VEGVGVTPEFWEGKRVLITGHTGFKGGWLSLWLQSLGANVVGYSLAAPSKPSLFEVARVADAMVSLEGDIRNLADVQAAFLTYQPEIVIHMAAQSLVRYSYQNPVETYATNVMGTVHVLEAVRHAPSVRAVVVVTSDKCYENKEWAWGYRENEAMGGYDPYSSSKGCAELVAAAYRQSFFNIAGRAVAIASARAGNVIGGGDWAVDRLIPDTIRAVSEQRPVLIRSPGAIRPWQHVLEPLSGYLTLAERMWSSKVEYASAWNFGPNDQDAKPVAWIVERITGLWGEGAQWKLDTVQHPHEAHYLKLDSSKSRAGLGWTPMLDLSETLTWIVDWYKAHSRNEDMRSYTETQIIKFQTLSKRPS
jgi:CDP-glucose 4,6-dehydratase